MTRLTLSLLVGAVVLAVAFFGLSGSCRRDEDGQRADSVLATDPAWQDTVRAQDSVIAKLEDSIRVTDADRKLAWDSAHTLTRKADADQAAIDRTVAAGVPPGVEPAAFWRNQFQAQARVAATLRLQVIPQLGRTIALDTVGIRQRDREIGDLKGQRDYARARVDTLTRKFREYREATKPGIDLGLFRIPDWVSYVAVATGAATVTYVAVK